MRRWLLVAGMALSGCAGFILPDPTTGKSFLFNNPGQQRGACLMQQNDEERKGSLTFPAWDDRTQTCYQLSPEQAAERMRRAKAEQEQAARLQPAPTDPLSCSFYEADKRFCTDERIRAAPYSCSMFREQSSNCMLLGGYAYSARLTYLTFKQGGMTNSQAIQLASRNMDIAELAGSAPEGTTPDEFRLAVVQSCLERAAQ